MYGDVRLNWGPAAKAAVTAAATGNGEKQSSYRCRFSRKMRDRNSISSTICGPISVLLLPCGTSPVFYSQEPYATCNARRPHERPRFKRRLFARGMTSTCRELRKVPSFHAMRRDQQMLWRMFLWRNLQRASAAGRACRRAVYGLLEVLAKSTHFLGGSCVR